MSENQRFREIMNRCALRSRTRGVDNGIIKLQNIVSRLNDMKEEKEKELNKLKKV